MGYDLHIVRRNVWHDYEEGGDISLEEWLAYVQSDDELELSDVLQIKIPGVPNSSQTAPPGFCDWTGHSTRVTNDKPWFSYGYGMISTKNPDDETIKKMISIAEKFQAKVQGDEGEFYDENYFLNNNRHSSPGMTNSISLKPWWMFWK